MTDREINALGLRIGLLFVGGLLVIGYAVEWSLKGYLSHAGYGSLVCWVIFFLSQLYGMVKETRRL
jgi:hypothetical protein